MSRAAVLVVEDEAANRDALVDYLEDEGFEPLAATDGVEALALLSARAVDVVITDLKMPRMPGLEFLEQVRRITSDP